MSIVMLLMKDMPKNCGLCPLQEDQFCTPLNTSVFDYLDGDKRAEICPLMNLPKKLKSTKPNKEETNVDVWFQHLYDQGYADGWNDCLKKIVEGNQENSLREGK